MTKQPSSNIVSCPFHPTMFWRLANKDTCKCKKWSMTSNGWNKKELSEYSLLSTISPISQDQQKASFRSLSDLPIV